MNDRERIAKLRYALILAEEAITETGRYTIWLQVIRQTLEDTRDVFRPTVCSTPSGGAGE